MDVLQGEQGRLISDVSLYRNAILESLMRGASLEEAFAPYRRPITSALRTVVNKPLRANAQAQQTQASPRGPSLAAGA